MYSFLTWGAAILFAAIFYAMTAAGTPARLTAKAVLLVIVFGLPALCPLLLGWLGTGTSPAHRCRTRRPLRHSVTGKMAASAERPNRPAARYRHSESAL